MSIVPRYPVSWARPPRGGLVALILVSLAPCFAAAQTAAPPAANPLPTVLYPDRDPDTAPPVRQPLTPAPARTPETDTGGPITYEVVDGVWGYYDRGRHFHPRMAHSFQDRPRVPELIPGRGADVSRLEAHPSLPRSVPRVIVEHSPSPRDREPVH